MNEQSALLRQRLKRARLALSASAQEEAAAAATARILKHPRFLQARRIAGYFASKGELDPMAVLERAAGLNKQCYLPVLHPFRRGQLWFCRWHPGEPLTLNRFDIPEPVVQADRLIPARDLDLVIVPLLGFDDECHRIGMGGGYYDRSFAFVRRLKHVRRPFMLGLAHESQHVAQLHTKPWDITLDAIVTERQLYARHKKR